MTLRSAIQQKVNEKILLLLWLWCCISQAQTKNKKTKLKPLPCRNLVYSLQTSGVSPWCAAWRHEVSGRRWTAELHRRRSSSGAVSPGCKLWLDTSQHKGRHVMFFQTLLWQNRSYRLSWKDLFSILPFPFTIKTQGLPAHSCCYSNADHCGSVAAKWFRFACFCLIVTEIVCAFTLTITSHNVDLNFNSD